MNDIWSVTVCGAFLICVATCCVSAALSAIADAIDRNTEAKAHVEVAKVELNTLNIVSKPEKLS